MDRHTQQLSLVHDKRLELGKCPRVECCALRLPSPDPRANVGQIFDRNRALRAFSLRNNLLGETVVDVFGKSGFLPSKNAQSAAAAQAAEPLQFIPEPPMPVAHVLDRPPAMEFPIAIDSDIRNPKVDTEHAFNVERIGRLNLAGSEQIPLPAHERQIAFAAPEGSNACCRLPVTKGIGCLPSIVQIDTDAPL
jgi:hypothetical protein